MPIGLVAIVLVLALAVGVINYLGREKENLKPRRDQNVLTSYPRVTEWEFEEITRSISFDLSLVEHELIEISQRVTNILEPLENLQAKVVSLQDKVNVMHRRVAYIEVPNHLKARQQKYMEMFAILRDELETARHIVGLGDRELLDAQIREIRDLIARTLR